MNDELIDSEVEQAELTPLRTHVNAAMRDEYKPEPDTNYRAGSMDYKNVPSRGIGA